nr:hypothetical protein [bacterium]
SSLTLWDIQSRAILRDFQHPTYYLGLALSADGKQVAAGYVSSEHVFVGLFDIETGNRTCGIDYQMKELPPGVQERTGPAISVAISPDGTSFITADSRGSLISWDTSTGNMIRQYDVYSTLFGIPRGRIAFLPDGKRIILNPGFSQVSLVDLEKDEIVYSVSGFPGYSLSADLSRFLVYAGWSIRLYDTLSGDCIRSVVLEKTTYNRAIALSPDASLATVDSEAGDEETYPLEVVDMNRGEVLRTYPFNAGGLVGFSPDGKYFLETDGKALSFYDISDLQAAVKEPGVENQGK